jgi:2-C-methyl-D-erythritol 2,4-cyclodiphosphate synthase
MRIGYGFDSHEFKKGVPLKIGGVELPHAKGLAGHSDGDVLLHAITDAMLGAVCAGDIGSHFPPSDPQWKGADSAVFLAEALRQVERAGYSIANIDASLILEAPKIGPHAEQIREHIAGLLKIGASQVSVKAKTPEGLGTKNTAIAHVVVLLTTRSEDKDRAMHEAEAIPQTEVDMEVEKVLETAKQDKVALPKRK